MRTTHHLLIFGRVQGVGYRESMRAEAQIAGCNGWVRNRADGSVEAMVEGAPDAVASMLTWSRRGPLAARVDRVQVSDGEGRFEQFVVARTL